MARLRQAGAVFLGKTNLHEFAYGISNANPHYGPVHNPWDEDRISGGSSGGSAASLAAGIGYGSVGSDTGGSIRIPASLCGTVGLKPTYGTVSRYGATPLAWSLDHVGPMARTVRDVAILFDLLAGYDPKDPTSRNRDPQSVCEGLEELPSGLLMAVHPGYFFEELEPEVQRLVETAVDDLQKLGLTRVDVSIPEIEHQGTCRNVITFAEASSYHESMLRERREDYGAATRELLELGLMLRATEYLTAQRARRRIVEAFDKAFQGFDVLVSPTVPVPAPRIGDELLVNGEKLRPGLLRLPTPFKYHGLSCDLRALRFHWGRSTRWTPVGGAPVLREAPASGCSGVRNLALMVGATSKLRLGKTEQGAR